MINDGIAGSNYGWPTCEGFCNPYQLQARAVDLAGNQGASTIQVTAR